MNQMYHWQFDTQEFVSPSPMLSISSSVCRKISNQPIEIKQHILNVRPCVVMTQLVVLLLCHRNRNLESNLTCLCYLREKGCFGQGF